VLSCQASTVGYTTTARDRGISVLKNCLEWDKLLFNTHLSHSRQLFNIHLYCNVIYELMSGRVKMLCDMIDILPLVVKIHAVLIYLQLQSNCRS